MGYFYEQDSQTINNFDQSPSPLAKRYQTFQSEFLRKFTKDGARKFDSCFIDKLDVILSPQQFGILFANPKILFCMGESGAGKTELLLAKALASALDKEVIRIYFCVPSKKGEKERKLWSLVNEFRNRHSQAFADKFEIISYDSLVDEKFHEQMPKDLSKVVVLIDEFHYRYDRNFHISPNKFRVMSLKIGPYLKHLWFATITLKWYVGMRDIIKTYVPLEFLSAKPLNVQFRSAEHIGKFCSNLVHADRLGKFSSIRVPGVFISGSQEKVRVEPFPQNLLNLEKQKTEPETTFDPLKSLSKNYSKNRWIIAVCSTENKLAWTNYMEKEFTGTEANFEIFTVSLEDGPPGCNFSGGETQSVVLFVDGPSKDEYADKKDEFDDIFLLACSRAQYELSVFVREDLSHIFQTFSKCLGQKILHQNHTASERSQVIANFLNDLETTVFTEDDVKRLFKEYKILLEVLTNRKPEIIRRNFLLLGYTLATDVLNVLLDDDVTGHGNSTNAGIVFKSKTTNFQYNPMYLKSQQDGNSLSRRSA